MREQTRNELGGFSEGEGSEGLRARGVFRGELGEALGMSEHDV